MGKSIIINFIILCVYLINLSTKLHEKKIQHCLYLFFVLWTSLAWWLHNSLSICLWYCMLYSFHFTAEVFQIIFLFSFRGVGAMEIVAMDMKVRSIVLSIVKCLIVLGKWVLSISRFNPFLFKPSSILFLNFDTLILTKTFNINFLCMFCELDCGY